jgi:hypothetical protein
VFDDWLRPLHISFAGSNEAQTSPAISQGGHLKVSFLQQSVSRQKLNTNSTKFLKDHFFLSSLAAIWARPEAALHIAPWQTFPDNGIVV